MDCESDVSTLKAMEDNPMGSQLHPEVNDRKVDQVYTPLMEDMQNAQVPYSSSMVENSNAQSVSSKINDISTLQQRIVFCEVHPRKKDQQARVSHLATAIGLGSEPSHDLLPQTFEDKTCYFWRNFLLIDCDW